MVRKIMAIVLCCCLCTSTCFAENPGTVVDDSVHSVPAGTADPSNEFQSTPEMGIDTDPAPEAVPAATPVNVPEEGQLLPDQEQVEEITPTPTPTPVPTPTSEPNIMEKPFEQYTPTEGYLFILSVLGVISLALGAFKLFRM